MTYQAIDQISQLFSLAAFVAMSVAAAIYAFWPGNRGAFERAASAPLRPDALEDEGHQ